MYLEFNETNIMKQEGLDSLQNKKLKKILVILLNSARTLATLVVR